MPRKTYIYSFILIVALILVVLSMVIFGQNKNSNLEGDDPMTEVTAESNVLLFLGDKHKNYLPSYEKLDALFRLRNELGLDLLREDEQEFLDRLYLNYHDAITYFIGGPDPRDVQKRVVDIFVKNGGVEFLKEKGMLDFALAQSSLYENFNLAKPLLIAGGNPFYFIDRGAVYTRWVRELHRRERTQYLDLVLQEAREPNPLLRSSESFKIAMSHLDKNYWKDSNPLFFNNIRCSFKLLYNTGADVDVLLSHAPKLSKDLGLLDVPKDELPLKLNMDMCFSGHDLSEFM